MSAQCGLSVLLPSSKEYKREMRSRFIKTIASAAAFAMLWVGSASAEQATVTGREVNVRSGPGMSYRVITSLPKGSAVEVTDRSNGTWYAVRFGNESGYMSSEYLSFDTAGASNMPDIFISDGNESILLPENGEVPHEEASAINGEENPGIITAPTEPEKPVQSSAPKLPVNIPVPPAVVSPVPLKPYYPPVPAAPATTPQPTATPAPTATPSLIPPPLPEITVAPMITALPAVTAAPIAEPLPGSAEDALKEQEANGIITGDYVRFRTGPSLSSAIIATYNKGTEVFSEEESSGWTKCIIHGKEGYVSSQYVRRSTGPAAADSSAAPVATAAAEMYSQSREGYIAGNNVRFRSSPSLSGRILGEFYFSNVVEITATSGEWTAVNARGQKGFVYSQYVKEGKYTPAEKQGQDPAEKEKQKEASSAVMTASTGRDVSDFALQYLGYRYCWGGADPATGFDCSGFVYYVYSRFGYTLNRVAADQAKNGTPVSENELQPGDILCFYSTGTTIGHSGIYIGDGKFIHSATSKTGVIITELSGNYAKRGYEARRIVN